MTTITTTIGSCSSGWTYDDSTNKCYKYFDLKVTYTEAEKTCKGSAPTGFDGGLVSISNPTVTEVIRKIDKHEYGTWTGGYRVNGKWVWADGSHFKYTNWNSGEPNNSGGDEDKLCVHPEGVWNDCSALIRPFICQYGKNSNHQQQAACKAGWTFFSRTGLCYKYISAKVHHIDAKNHCKSLSYKSSLVSIHNKETNSFIMSLSGQTHVWLGGYRVYDGRNKWAWYDGTPWDYALWSSGEPNDYEGVEDFVGLYKSGYWNDFAKNWGLSFVCQAPPTYGRALNQATEDTSGEHAEAYQEYDGNPKERELLEQQNFTSVLEREPEGEQTLEMKDDEIKFEDEEMNDEEGEMEDEDDMEDEYQMEDDHEFVFEDEEMNDEEGEMEDEDDME